MDTEEISNTGDCVDNLESSLETLERSIDTVLGDQRDEMPTIESFEAYVENQLSDILKNYDKNEQLSTLECFTSMFDRLDNVQIENMESDEAVIHEKKKELLGIKDVAPPAKYEELSRRLLKIEDTVNERKKKFLKISLRLRNLFTTLCEKSMLNEDKKQELVEKLLGVKISAAEENME